jgi:CubicO group peptidase (beta-lactamase class C family)
MKFSVLLSCVLLLGPAGAGAAPALEPGRAEALRAVWREGISGGFVPGGVMLVLHRGEPVFREAFGRPDLARPAALSVDTPFRIASVTKPFTATLLAILVAEGRLQWDDPVDRHLPEFRGVRVDGGAPARRPPLVRELLSHTAGFAGQQARGEERWRFRTDGTLADAVRDLARAGLSAEPGSRYAYSGFGYMVAGRVAEVAGEAEFAGSLARRLLLPIGAGEAGFLAEQSAGRRARLPVFYEWKDGVLSPAAAAGRDEPPLAFPNPGGGLVATVDEVAALLLLHRNRGRAGGRVIVPDALIADLHTVQPGTARDGYGLGFNVVRPGSDGRGARLRHNGASGTLAVLDLDRDYIVVALTQVPTKQRMPFTRRLDAAIEALIDGR